MRHRRRRQMRLLINRTRSPFPIERPSLYRDSLYGRRARRNRTVTRKKEIAMSESDMRAELERLRRENAALGVAKQLQVNTVSIWRLRIGENS
jgi:hypothetical protein